MAQRRLPSAAVSAVLVTVKVESIWRPSSSSTRKRRRKAALRCNRRDEDNALAKRPGLRSDDGRNGNNIA